jgi:putative DNA primase/helicase
MLVGPKRAGKGVIARILRALVGEKNTVGPTLNSLATPFGLWSLWGKSLAIISDARLSGRIDSSIVTERLLSISGEDTLTVERKCMEAVTCKLPTRLMILSNELPRLGDASGALASRMILLRLTQSFYGAEDPDLTDRLLGELPAILLWAVAGWYRLHKRKRFAQPESAGELLDALYDLSSPIGEFVRTCCEVGPACRIPRADLYAAYKEWAEGKGRKNVEDSAGFGRFLRAAVPTVRDTQPRIGGEKVRHYEGIQLTPFGTGGT